MALYLQISNGTIPMLIIIECMVKNTGLEGMFLKRNVADASAFASGQDLRAAYTDLKVLYMDNAHFYVQVMRTRGIIRLQEESTAEQRMFEMKKQCSPNRWDDHTGTVVVCMSTIRFEVHQNRLESGLAEACEGRSVGTSG
jgi:hypothetical protein